MRAVGSQLVVETIEDALRQGGLALFDEGFQLDSSLNWVFGETIEGEVDVVVPLWNGGRHVIFAQPGVIFWTGLEEEERIDGSIGAVYRAEIANGVIGGGSIFYDYDFQYGHSRIGGGIDLQSGVFQGALNYYHPLSDVEDGREGFVEEALRGMDLRVALEREAMRVSANLGYWRFEGDEDVKGDWKPSYGFDAGIRIVPGVFLEGGWERHDETVSLDERWNAGLAFRFSLPGFEGASYGDGGLSSNLWKLVEREKRILYEERLGIPRVNLTTMTARVVEPAATGGSETAVVMADLGKALEEDVTLHIMVAETSTATLGTDFTYGHKVYELDAATGEQSAPAGDAVSCPEDPAMACEVMIPAGVTRFDIEAEIAMTAEREISEFIDFQIEVPEEHADLLRGGSVARVAIEAHGNEVAFAADAATTLAEDNETTGVEVSVSVDKPSPTPITLNVATDGTATVNEDYRISTRSLTIPANASSASLTLWGINNNRGEGSKSIVLTISGNLPEGWTITDDEHTVTLQDDDLSIFFTGATTSRVDEPGTGSNADVTISLGITQAPTANITVRVAAGGTGETATPGSSMDYTFTGMDFTFPADSTASQTATFSVHPDNVAEEDEFIVLTLADDSTNSRDAEGSGFSLGNPHTITIPANDNTVGFASSSATTLAEDNTTTGVAVRVEVVEPAPTQITLNVALTGTATVNEDYSISARSLTIPANTRMSDSLTLWGMDNMESEGSKQIVLTFTGNLPDGWDFASDPFAHTITLQDDDLSVGFAKESNTIDEPASDTDYMVDIEITQAPAENIILQISRASSSTADTTGDDIDVTFSPSTVTFMKGTTTLKQTVTLNVKADTIAEGAEFIELELDDGGTLTSGDNMFSFGRQAYRLNINASDNTISIDSMSPTRLDEDGTIDVTVKVEEPSPAEITLNVTAASSSTAPSSAYTFPNGSTLTIPANSNTGMFRIAGVDNEGKAGTLSQTIDLEFRGNNLPTGWTLSSDPLTHQVNIIDDEGARIGWTVERATHNAPASGSNTYTARVKLSESPSQMIRIGVDTDLGTAKNGTEFVTGGSRDCSGFFVFQANAADDELTQECDLIVRASAANKMIVMGLTDSLNNLETLNILLDPARTTITVNEAPKLGFASPTDTVDAPATANRIHDVTIEISDDTSTAIPFIVEVTGGTKASVGVGGDWSYASQRGCDEASFTANGSRTVTCRLVIFPTAKGKTLTLTIKEAASSTAIADAGFTINPATQMLTVN